MIVGKELRDTRLAEVLVVNGENPKFKNCEAAHGTRHHLPHEKKRCPSGFAVIPPFDATTMIENRY